MINLLPETYLNYLHAVRKKKLIVLLGVSVFSLIFIFIITLTVLYVSFLIQKTGAVRQLEAIRQSSIFAEVSDIENSIKDVNDMLASWKKKEDDRFALAPIIGFVLREKPEGVLVNFLSFRAESSDRPNNPSMLIVRGRALSRQDLLDFIGRLNGMSAFKNVRSPISNILQEKNVDFSITLEIRS